MLDLSMVNHALGSLTAVKTLLEGAVAANKQRTVQEVRAELIERIIAAQDSIVTVKEECSSLLEKNRELTREIKDLREWEADKENYHLIEISRGSFVYSKKEETGPAEPAHYICCNCYTDQKKSILQRKPASLASRHLSIPNLLQCPRCKSEVISP